jgi:hypothetical protein
MKELKFVYETTVKQQVEESVKEKKEEGGETIEFVRKVKKIKPVKVAILKPDRSLFKGAEMFYSKSLADYLKAGLMPYSLVAKRYTNDGGPLSDVERTRLKELREEGLKLESEFYASVNTDIETVKQKNETLIRLNDINTEVSNIQNAYSDIFESAAETKARNDTMEWWSLHLSYKDDGKGYKCIFGDGSYEERVKELETLEDRENDFELEVNKKLAFLISFWFTARSAVNKNDFEAMDKLFESKFSAYAPEEGESLQINDLTPNVKTDAT